MAGGIQTKRRWTQGASMAAQSNESEQQAGRYNLEETKRQMWVQAEAPVVEPRRVVHKRRQGKKEEWAHRGKRQEGEEWNEPAPIPGELRREQEGKSEAKETGAEEKSSVAFVPVKQGAAGDRGENREDKKKIEARWDFCAAADQPNE